MLFSEVEAPRASRFQIDVRRSFSQPPWQECNLERTVQLLFLPTCSFRRRSLIQAAYPDGGVRIISIPSQLDEPLTPDPQTVVQTKLDRVRLDAQNWVTELQSRLRVGSIAGDVLIDANGHTLIKPKSEDDIRQAFRNILESEREHVAPHYTLNTACGVWRAQQDDRNIATISTETVYVAIFRAAAHILNTEAGYREYMAGFEAFYQSPIFMKHGVKTITPYETNGGLSLEVLTKMGYVEHINGVFVHAPEFRRELSNASRIVMSGYTMDGLNLLHPEAARNVSKWDYLNQIADYTLPTQTYAATA